MWVHPAASYYYYRCSGRDRRICNAPFVLCEKVDAEALELVKALVLPSPKRDTILRLAQQASTAETLAVPAIDASMLQRQLERLALAYAAGDLSHDTYKAERTRLRASLHEAQHHAQAPLSEVQVQQLLDNLADLLSAATLEKQRAVMRTVFDTLWLEPHRITAMRPVARYHDLVSAAVQAQGFVVTVGRPIDLAPQSTAAEEPQSTMVVGHEME